jgi:hypothetical protein
MGRFFHSSSSKTMACARPQSSCKTMGRPCPSSSCKTMACPCATLSAETMNQNRESSSAQAICELCNSLSSKHPPAPFRPRFLSPLQRRAKTVSPLFSGNLYLLLKSRVAFSAHIYNTNSFRPVFLGVAFSQIQGLSSLAIFYSISSDRR